MAKFEVEIAMTPEVLARAWCDMNDQNQADFFIACAKIMGEWKAHERLSQLYAVGNHLRDCGCSSDDARAVVDEIHAGMVAERLGAGHG